MGENLSHKGYVNRVMQFSYGQEGSAGSQETPIPPKPLRPIIPLLQDKGEKETMAGVLGWGMVF